MFKRHASTDRERFLDLLHQLDRYQTGGVPPGEALAILKTGPGPTDSRRFLQTLQDSYAKSRGLADGLAQYPRVFYPFLTDLVRRAEQDHRGPAMLQQCVAFLERITILDPQNKQSIKAVIDYPLMMAVVLFLLMAMLLIFVIPTFEEMFQSFGANLPDLTLSVIALSHGFSDYWWVALGVILILYFLWRSAKNKWPVLAPFSGRFWRWMPVIGTIYARIALMRFLRTVAFMLAANRTLPDALSAAAIVVDPPYDQALQRVRTQALSGQSLADALRKETLFDRQIIEAAAVGERTHTLSAVFDVLADQYQRQLQSPLLARRLEVILMILLATVVGVFMIAMYLPLFKLAGSL